jgi:sec-independent protein translocase protein TatA
MNALQPWHLIFVLIIALLVFGPKKLPELGKNLGRGMRDFKRAVSGEDEDERRAEQQPVTQATLAPPAEPLAATPPPQQPAAVPQQAPAPRDDVTSQS